VFLAAIRAVLDGYDGEQMIWRRETVTDRSQERLLEEMLIDPLVQYVMVCDAAARCFDFCIGRAEGC
jgi:hypothetical protein